MESLPPISSLATADDKGIISVLDVLFEPAPEIHALAVPAIKQQARVPANPGLSADLPPPPTPPSAVRATTVPATPFTSYASLIKHVGDLMMQLAASSATDPASQTALHGVLGSHPRLGAKKVDSAQSRAEQANLNAGTDQDQAQAQAQAEKLRLLNEEYEARFPGLRYVVFVNGRSRPVVMEDMRRRIDRGDIREEEREGVRAMVDIALDRAGKLQG